MSLVSPAYITSTHWFLFVVVTAFIATLLWICMYFLGVREVLNLSIDWILTVIHFNSFFSRKKCKNNFMGRSECLLQQVERELARLCTVVRCRVHDAPNASAILLHYIHSKLHLCHALRSTQQLKHSIFCSRWIGVRRSQCRNYRSIST